jgi:hypothetical protein
MPAPAPGPALGPAPETPGEAYTQARRIEIPGGALPCPEECAQGETRSRCTVEAQITFLDLVAEGSHREVRAVLEKAPGPASCVDGASPDDATFSALRIPLDFSVAVDGRATEHARPAHDPDPALEGALHCVRTWLSGLRFPSAGRPLRVRTRLQVDPIVRCRAPAGPRRT